MVSTFFVASVHARFKGVPPHRRHDGNILSILDYIPSDEHEAIIEGRSRLDCTEHIKRAISDTRKRRGTLYFPKGIFNASEIRIEGDGYRINADSDTWFRKKYLTGLDYQASAPFININFARNIELSDLNIIGSIDLEEGEFGHAVAIISSRNVRIAKVYGRNVRGDVVYCVGRSTSEEERLTGVNIDSISGSNIYRNLLSVLGGEVHVGELRNAGPVGYRDFDVEPNNAAGSYEPVRLTIDRAVIGSAEITSDDPAVINTQVRIGVLDADRRRVRPSSPSYPGAPGEGAYALGVARTETVRIDYFRARNYNVYPLSLAIDWTLVEIGTFDVANCALDDPRFSTLILQHADAAGGSVRIGTLRCSAPPGRYLARVQNNGLLHVEVDAIDQMQCMIGTGLTGRIANGKIDLNGAEGIAMIDCHDLRLENIITVNGEAVVGLSHCTDITFVRSRLNFKTLAIASANLKNVTSRITEVVRGTVRARTE